MIQWNCILLSLTRTKHVEYRIYLFFFRSNIFLVFNDSISSDCTAILHFICQFSYNIFRCKFLFFIFYLFLLVRSFPIQITFFSSNNFSNLENIVFPKFCFSLSIFTKLIFHHLFFSFIIIIHFFQCIVWTGAETKKNRTYSK